MTTKSLALRGSTSLSNPLTTGKGGGKVTKEMLFDYADRLNRELWVQLSGQPYFVNKRLGPTGEPIHFLDRHSAA